MEDFYHVLGVASSATPEEIKAAYRRLSMLYHPDRETGNAQIFQKVTKAYEILGDAQKRKEYDATLASIIVSDPLQTAREIWTQQMKGILS